MKTTAIIEIGKDLSFDIYTTDEKLGFMLLGQGKTVVETKADFLACEKDLERLYKKQGKTSDFKHLESEYKYDAVSFLKYSPCSLSSLSAAIGINENQLNCYITEASHPSKLTLAKIEKAVEFFAADYQKISFVG